MQARTAEANARATAFAALVDRRLDHAYRMAGYILGDAGEAQDVVQDAVVRAWQGWEGLRETDRFDQWFDRIVVNICRDQLRRRRTIRFVELDAELPVAAVDPFRGALARADLERLLPVLDADQRIVIALRYWSGLTVDEIALRLGIPSGTVKSRIHYALEAMRKACEPTPEVTA